MGRWTAESTGMAVLRPIAKEHLKKHNVKSRVWSDELGSWGLFSKDANDLDEFIIWCSLEPGDRLAVPGGVEHKAEVLERAEAIEVFYPVRQDYL